MDVSWLSEADWQFLSRHTIPCNSFCPRCGSRLSSIWGPREGYFGRCGACGWGGSLRNARRCPGAPYRFGSCFHCGGQASQYDHLIPQAFRGPDEAWNLVASCPGCNNRRPRDGRDLFEIMGKLPEDQEDEILSWLGKHRLRCDVGQGLMYISPRKIRVW